MIGRFPNRSNKIGDERNGYSECRRYRCENGRELQLDN